MFLEQHNLKKKWLLGWRSELLDSDVDPDVFACAEKWSSFSKIH